MLFSSCGRNKATADVLEPIVHEKVDPKARGEVSSRELKILHGTLKKLNHQLSGENEAFNSSLKETEEQLQDIPRQLEEVAGALQTILDRLESTAPADKEP